MLKRDGTVIEKIDTDAPSAKCHRPARTERFRRCQEERADLCLILDEGRTFVALRQLASFDERFSLCRPAGRPVHDRISETGLAARCALQCLRQCIGAPSRSPSPPCSFRSHWSCCSSAIWLGLAFANTARCADPTADRCDRSGGDRQSICAACPLTRSEGDLAHLGETFNKMTSELRLQQNRLVAASNLIDERRVFTEAVLSGVPVAVIGVGPKGAVTSLIHRPRSLIPEGSDAPETLVGRPCRIGLPRNRADPAGGARPAIAAVQGQIAVNRAGRDRLFNVRVTSDPTARSR